LVRILNPPKDWENCLQSRLVNDTVTQHQSAVFISLSRLPPFHPAALKLLNISVGTESAISEFESVFKSDPALAADLLLVANSVQFGLPCRIDNIRHALTYMGLERVRSLGCTIGFSFYVRNLPRTEHIQIAWRHAIATAVIAESLAARNRMPTLYTAGLMHDIGRLALLLTAGESYEKLLAHTCADIAVANEMEQAHFSVNHCEAGIVMAENWGLPDTLRNCIADHHAPAEAAAPHNARLVRLACGLADALGFRESGNCESPLLRPEDAEDLLVRFSLRRQFLIEKIGVQVDQILK
jgi:putative nucleotidyltransferase with HDIG domain